MGFVEQLLIDLETSFIWLFFSYPFDVLLGVTYENMLMATQWPLKRAPHLQRFVYKSSKFKVFYLSLLGHWPLQAYICKQNHDNKNNSNTIYNQHDG